MLSLVHLIWWNHYILLNYLNNSCHNLTYFTASELQIFSVSVANNLVVLRYVTHCAISLIANLVHKAFYMLHKCCSVEKRFRIVFSWLPQEIIWNTWNTRLGTWKRQFSTMGFDGVGPVENSHWLNCISVTYGQAQSNLLESRFFLT